MRGASILLRMKLRLTPPLTLRLPLRLTLRRALMLTLRLTPPLTLRLPLRFTLRRALMLTLRLTLILTLLLLPAVAEGQRTDFSGLRIFINPGHGGHDGDDRHMEETDFWESEGNLAKGLFLRDLLERRNATVFMSRTTNYTSDDLPLSTIAAMANTANADLFLSIHSNGYDGSRNQPLTLFRGYDNAPVYPAAKSFAHILWEKLFEKGGWWTHTAEWVKGDWTFYPEWGDKVGLGVLRTLTLPGVLSEGSFHDYVPEGWRLRNDDHLHHEAWAMLRAMQQHFNVVPEEHGIIAGVVRDSHTTPPWYFGPATADRYMPLNGVTVTLMPSGRTVTTDILNNGFFMFDSVPPGSWTLVTGETDDFFAETLIVEVVAGKSTVVDLLPPFNTQRLPLLAGTLPSTTDSLSFSQPITFIFNLPMERTTVEQSLTIEPATALNFSWDDRGRELTVTPQPGYSSATPHTITITAEATSLWGVPLAEPVSYTFVTRARTQLLLEQVWPDDGAAGITLYPRITVKFDTPPDQASARAAVQVTGSVPEPLVKSRERFFTVGEKGLYTFELAEPLTPATLYQLTVEATVEDITGLTPASAVTHSFTTRSEGYHTGTVVESFNDIAVFWDPEASGSTTGTDNIMTTFTASADYYYSPPLAGRLDYLFTGNQGGVCRVFDTRKPSVGSRPSQFFTVWVYGDLSNNELEYWFYSSGSNNHIVPAGTIDWAGWDQVTIPLTSVGGSGDKQFHSLVVRQVQGASRSGTLWFDDAMLIDPSSAGAPHDEDVALTLAPNPLAGDGLITFFMPSPGRAEVTLWSSSGRQVATLFRGSLEAGRQQLPFHSTTALTPGIYIIRLARESGSDTRYSTGRWVILR